MTSEAIRQSYMQVMDAYASLGYPRELLGQWSLPERDAATLLRRVESLQPENILEVGTFVGVTTQLFALHAPRACIHSIDPNLPLRVEMSATRSNLYDCNVDIKTQDLGHAVAQRLGVHERIFFHAGGFSTCSTFAANNVDPTTRVPVIGEEICSAYGPFDFIFVDALHYEPAVFSDLHLAAACLTPNGVIALHDVKGRWGGNVRRAVFRFLADHDDFVFFHTPFTELYEAIGFLWRRTARPSQYDMTSTAHLQTRGLLQSTILSNLSSTLVEMFAPKRVIQFGDGCLDLSVELVNRGVEQVRTIHVDTLDADLASIKREGRFDCRSHVTPETKYDLCLCLGVAEKLAPELAANLIEACIEASDRVIFGFTPPGEMGETYPNLHPTAYWMKQFLTKGYIFKDTIRSHLEPLTYFDLVIPDYQVTGAYLLSLYEVEKAPGIAGPVCDVTLLENFLLSKENRIEDLALQNLTQSLIIFDAREQLCHARQVLQQREQELQHVQQESQNALQELQVLHAQLHGTQVELHDTQVELHDTQAQLHDTQVELHGTQAQLHDTQVELHDTQAQLHDTQAQLYDTQVWFHNTQAQLHDAQAQLQAVQAEVARCKSSWLLRLASKIARG